LICLTSFTEHAYAIAKLHGLVKAEKCSLDDIEVLILKNPTLKTYNQIDEKSVLSVALESKKFEVFSYLSQSQGFLPGDDPYFDPRKKTKLQRST
jgi:hypothetical protein